MSKTTESGGSLLLITSVITAVLVTIKLTTPAAFPWWVAFLPLMIYVGLIALVLGVVGLVMIVAAIALSRDN